MKSKQALYLLSIYYQRNIFVTGNMIRRQQKLQKVYLRFFDNRVEMLCIFDEPTRLYDIYK